MLSDRGIQHEIAGGNIQIKPFAREQLQPASYDLTLFDYVYVFKPRSWIERLLGLRKRVTPRLIDIGLVARPCPLYLRPNHFMLASTRETITLSPEIVGQINGKSSRARDGFIVENAGFVDPGFSGQLTLELTNIGPNPLPLIAGMSIAQIAFSLMTTTVERPYGHPELQSHYRNQYGPTLSRA